MAYPTQAKKCAHGRRLSARCAECERGTPVVVPGWHVKKFHGMDVWVQDEKGQS